MRELAKVTGNAVCEKCCRPCRLSKVEVSFEETGKLLGVEGMNMGTYTAITKPDGSLEGIGEGVFATIDGEFATWRGMGVGEIQSVYTSRVARPPGVFKALYSHVESLARESGGVCGLRLYNEAHNQRAQAFMKRCGMKEAVYRMFEVDYSLMPRWPSVRWREQHHSCACLEPHGPIYRPPHI